MRPYLAPLVPFMLLMFAGCGDDGGGDATTSPGDPTGAANTGTLPTSSANATSGTQGVTEEGEGTAAGSSGTGPTGDDTTGATSVSTSGGTSTGTSTGTGETSTEDPGETGSTGAPVVIPDGVYLWTGSSGGGGDMNPDDVYDLIAGTGAMVELSDAAPPADLLAAGFGTLVYMSPIDAFPPEVDASATTLVAGGGRLVLLMEHCKGGCYGNADGLNALLAGLGAGMRFFGDGGTPLSESALPVTTAVAPLTDGVATITVYYSGHIVPGAQTSSIALYNDETIVAHEVAGGGEVLGVADGSMFGYVLAKADNQQFIRNFAAHGP